MTDKFITFDIETAADISTVELNYARIPKMLGISCGAISLDNSLSPEIFQGKPRMTKEQAIGMLRKLQEYVKNGYSIVTWNGCKFDFQVLAMETDLFQECSELALNHVDLMLFVTFNKGYFLSLQKALTGAGLKGKLKDVKLNDGTTINSMDGGRAPELWAKGEYQAVIAYLEQDVIQLRNLVDILLKTRMLNWTSNSGKIQQLPIRIMLPVKDCFSLPNPDVSWMNDPPKRADFISWMKGYNTFADDLLS